MQITDEMVEAFGNAFWSVNAASKIDGERENIRAALDAALSTDAEPVAEGWLYDQECGNAFKSYWKTIFIDREPGPMRGIRNIRKVFTAPPAPSVAVKALEWQSRGRKNGDTYANSVVGQYSVGDIWGEIKSLLRTIVDGQDDDQVLGVHGSFEDAKAAAQADYEARIRSALSAQVQDVAETYADKIRKAAECLLSPDDNGSRKLVYDALEGKVKVYKFNDVLRTLAAPAKQEGQP